MLFDTMIITHFKKFLINIVGTVLVIVRNIFNTFAEIKGNIRSLLISVSLTWIYVLRENSYQLVKKVSSIFHDLKDPIASWFSGIN